MYFGFSKNIGKGFRVGAFFPTGRRGGARQGQRLTQANLRQQAREIFLENTRTRFDALVAEFFFSQGHIVFAQDFRHCNLEIAEVIRPIVEIFNKSQRLVNDGGSLTSRRKDQMLESIYSMEDAVNGLVEIHPLAQEYVTYVHVSRSSGASYVFGVIFLIIGLFFSTWLLIAVPVLTFAGYLTWEAIRLKRSVLATAISVTSQIPSWADVDQVGRSG